MEAVHKNEIRPSVVAGFFYPDARKQLALELEALLHTAPPPELEGNLKALVTPHAGYRYSGQVAATGFRHLQNLDAAVVAVVSPSHHDFFPGISVFNGKAYKTPLGLAPVASDLATALIEADTSIRSSWLGHRKEHALEVQLPFIQLMLPKAKIIPIAIGHQDYELCRRLGETLASVLKQENALIVATSDLSHFHPYYDAVAIDARTSKLIAGFDAARFHDAIRKKICEACGAGPIVAAMVASRGLGANHSRVLIYQNSGDVSGDYSKVVGYLTAAFYESD